MVLKQSLQYTGRSPRGLKGTMVLAPHWAHTAGCISLGPCRKVRCSLLRFSRQLGQRFGSLVYPLEAKNSCSPTVKVKLLPHSTQLRVLSESATGRPPFWESNLAKLRSSAPAVRRGK